jgi:hypothetical protein
MELLFVGPKYINSVHVGIIVMVDQKTDIV